MSPAEANIWEGGGGRERRGWDEMREEDGEEGEHSGVWKRNVMKCR